MLRRVIWLCVASFVLVAPCGSVLAEEEPEAVIELGSAAGEPGEVVEVPLLATYDEDLLSFVVAFLFDPDRLRIVGFDVAGTEASHAHPTSLVLNTYEPGEGLCGVVYTGRYLVIPPGERRLIGKISFRVEAEAPPGPTALEPVLIIPAHPEVQTNLTVGPWVDAGATMAWPLGLVAGEVEVLAPTRPRPVADLTCAQRLDQVKLSFRPVEACDHVEISRGGLVVATLPGDATSYSDPFPGVGIFSYGVTAQREGAASVEIPCTVSVVPPTAPAVTAFICEDGALSWKNPVVYERIVVTRGGEPIAELPGDAQGYSDPDPPESTTVYGVAGVLEGYQGAETCCVHRAVWIVEVPDVEVPLGAEQFEIPVLITTAAPLQGFGVTLSLDQSRFELIREYEGALVGTASHPDTEYIAMGPSPGLEEPSCGLIFDMMPPIEREKYFPQGVRQTVVRMAFRPLGEFSDGDAFPVSVRPETVEGSQTNFPVIDVTSEVPLVFSKNADLLVPGEIRFGVGPVAPVEGLWAEPEAGAGAEGGGAASPIAPSDVLLSWRNAGSYEGIRLERNGALVAELPGDAEDYLDSDVSPGVYTYKVIAEGAGEQSFPATAFIVTVRARAKFLRGDSTHDEVVDLTDAIVLLRLLFQSGPALPCDDAADADDDGELSVGDAVLILAHLYQGLASLPSPGSLLPWTDPTPDALGCAE